MVKTSSILKWLITAAVHIIFWIGVYFFYTYFLGYGTNNTNYVNKFSLFLMPITICTSYFFLFFLIPKYLLQKKQVLFILYTVYTFIISSFFIILSILYGLIFSYDLTTNDASPLTKTLPFIVFGVYFIVLVVIMLGMVMHNYQSALKSEDLRSKFLATQLQLKEQELKFLKMQIHPHFLFNTLNTLYGFALKKSDTTPNMILKLSNLLDYILYQVDKPFVLLSDEIKHIDDYISLEKMRFQDSLSVKFEKEFHQQNIKIAPMLLLPFVENAFKHGTYQDDVLTINIDLVTQEDKLFFSITNSAKTNTNTKKGIGLENIKKRLEMLYKEQSSLTINQTENKFLVNLIIPLQNE
ncbi:histidine kinase [Tenacibaculum holothuriorum]|uniref:Histidine kinase n=1 Tax=Tenacibaculum holothuriorum TaxID=1635173 RepID=A0A1Y2PAJ2_9FLAO|nr:histidine kinase [Tenacibaculum holothuriorum]OSY87473.1 histidine kinase [Tenacibaculum holothuriorum]